MIRVARRPQQWQAVRQEQSKPAVDDPRTELDVKVREAEHVAPVAESAGGRRQQGHRRDVVGWI
jgi:hypothetical protein